MIPWSLYLFYGDRCLLEEEYRNMKAWVEFISNREGEIPGRGPGQQDFTLPTGWHWTIRTRSPPLEAQKPGM